MNQLDIDYVNILQDILDNGVEKNTRNGKTLSVFGRTIRFKFNHDNFPILTTKKMSLKNIATELLWFLNGRTDLKHLLDNNCNIWNGDTYQFYLKKQKKLNKTDVLDEKTFINKIKNDVEFSNIYGDLGKIYGYQWRKWLKIKENYTIRNNDGSVTLTSVTENVDQLSDVISKLKNNPDDRGIIISAWNPSYFDDMVLRPCHHIFQFYTRDLTWDERKKLFQKDFDGILTENLANEIGLPSKTISLMWSQRSCDFPLGIPYNITSYGLMLEIIAKMVNMVPDELIGSLGDCHIYLNQIEGVKEQIGRNLTDEERYKIWFNNNYQTGMEYYFNPADLPNFDDDFYVPTPKRTREPFKLPKLKHKITSSSYKEISDNLKLLEKLKPDDFILDGYKSHDKIHFPLSN